MAYNLWTYLQFINVKFCCSCFCNCEMSVLIGMLFAHEDYVLKIRLKRRHLTFLNEWCLFWFKKFIRSTHIWPNWYVVVILFFISYLIWSYVFFYRSLFSESTIFIAFRVSIIFENFMLFVSHSSSTLKSFSFTHSSGYWTH